MRTKPEPSNITSAERRLIIALFIAVALLVLGYSALQYKQYFPEGVQSITYLQVCIAVGIMYVGTFFTILFVTCGKSTVMLEAKEVVNYSIVGMGLYVLFTFMQLKQTSELLVAVGVVAFIFTGLSFLHIENCSKCIVAIAVISTVVIGMHMSGDEINFAWFAVLVLFAGTTTVAAGTIMALYFTARGVGKRLFA